MKTTLSKCWGFYYLIPVSILLIRSSSSTQIENSTRVSRRIFLQNENFLIRFERKNCSRTEGFKIGDTTLERIRVHPSGTGIHHHLKNILFGRETHLVFRPHYWDQNVTSSFLYIMIVRGVRNDFVRNTKHSVSDLLNRNMRTLYLNN